MRQLRVSAERIIYVMLAACMLCGLAVPSVSAGGGMGSSPTGENTFADDRTIYYTALGDSIPNGYCTDGESEIVSYPELIVQDLQSVSETDVELAQDTKNGLTTVKLNSVILRETEVQESLSQSDIVTMTIGANDLMNEFKKVSREILNNDTHFYTVDEALKALEDGVKKNPLLLVKVAGAISGWDYNSFEEQWKQAMETVNSLRPEDSQLVVTTLYNPLERMELPGTLNAVVNSLISKMNDIIQSYAEEYNYQVVELMDSGIGQLTQSDGLHPNQNGQELIRDLMEEKLQSEEFAQIREQRKLEKERQIEEQKKAEEKAQKAREKLAQLKQQRQEQERRKHEAISCIIVCVSVGLMVILRRKTENQGKGTE